MLKLFIILIVTLFLSNGNCSSPAKNSQLINFYSISLLKNKQNRKDLKILVGSARKDLIIGSIRSLCNKKSLKCVLSDNQKTPVSTIYLVVTGLYENILNIEKLID